MYETSSAFNPHLLDHGARLYHVGVNLHLSSDQVAAALYSSERSTSAAKIWQLTSNPSRLKKRFLRFLVSIFVNVRIK